MGTLQNKKVIIQSDRQVRHLLPFFTQELELVFSAMAEEADLATCYVELSLPRDAEMATLNKNAMGCTGPTNVLSFPAPEGEDILGWMALAPETCAREAFIYGQDRRDYALRLIAHGYAHLLGFDHGEEMDEIAQRLFTRAGKALTMSCI